MDAGELEEGPFAQPVVAELALLGMQDNHHFLERLHRLLEVALLVKDDPLQVLGPGIELALLAHLENQRLGLGQEADCVGGQCRGGGLLLDLQVQAESRLFLLFVPAQIKSELLGRSRLFLLSLFLRGQGGCARLLDGEGPEVEIFRQEEEELVPVLLGELDIRILGDVPENLALVGDLMADEEEPLQGSFEILVLHALVEDLAELLQGRVVHAHAVERLGHLVLGALEVLLGLGVVVDVVEGDGRICILLVLDQVEGLLHGFLLGALD